MKAHQFEIWLADLNPQIGTETGKVRPVLVVQTNLLNQIHPSTIICPITSMVNIEAKLLRVNLKKSQSGMLVASDIMIDQIRAIDNKRLIKKLGALDTNTIKIIKKNIKIILDLE